MAGHTCYVHCNFRVIIVFRQGWLHKALATKELIISPTYLTSLNFSLIFRNILYVLLLLVLSWHDNYNVNNNNNKIDINYIWGWGDSTN